MAERRHGVLLVEDDTVTRARLARVIAAHDRLALVGEAGSAADARALVGRVHPEVLLTDLGLPDGSGIDLIREARQRWPDVLPLVITVFGDEAHVVAALEAGALGYLLKDGTAEYIGASIMDMLAGGSPISPAIARHLLRRFRGSETAEAPRGDAVPRLSEREGEVLRLIVKGFTYAEIAELLGVSAHTVTSHVRGIYRKLEVHSRGEAVYEALQLGLVKVDE
ncbi:MAG TPA: response regulator transcription factor [Candidatus Limnocylindria bacterium]|nr:response regulator transcription factor [Candidatus Limnocylindria bacterium]